MITVCLIGNSHVANLKVALPDVQPDFPDIHPVFFASDGVSMELDIVDGKLAARADHVRDRMAMTSGTGGIIAPVYDAYVLCGLTLSSMRALRTVAATIQNVRAAGRAGAPAAADFAAGMAPPVQGSLAIDIAYKLRQLTQAPIFVIATPLTAHERHAEIWAGRQVGQRVDVLAEAYNLACAKAAADCGAIFVPQPLETVGPNALTTRPEFYRLPPQEVKGENAHHTHMNAAFGAIVLRDVLARIAGLRH